MRSLTPSQTGSGGERVEKVGKQPDRLNGPSRLGRQVSSGSLKEKVVDVAR